MIICFLALSAVLVACNDKKEETKTASGSKVDMPYKANYATEFTNDISDSMLLLTLNSYKYWETGDMNALRSTMGDSVSVQGADGFRYNGLTDSLMPKWKAVRDSISSVAITIDVWLKNHSVKDSMDYINVWYKEIDTYKNGKVDSANYEDDNGLKNGKIAWFSSHRQELTQKKKM
jgi:Beta-lactamase class D